MCSECVYWHVDFWLHENVTSTKDKMAVSDASLTSWVVYLQVEVTTTCSDCPGRSRQCCIVSGVDSTVPFMCNTDICAMPCDHHRLLLADEIEPNVTLGSHCLSDYLKDGTTT